MTLFKAALAFRRSGDNAHFERAWKALRVKLGKRGLKIGEKTLTLVELRKEVDKQRPPEAVSGEWRMFRGDPTRSAAAPGGRVEGFFLYQTGEETFPGDLAFLLGLIADGRLDPQVPVVRDWSETVEAVDSLRDRRATGKVVLTRS